MEDRKNLRGHNAAACGIRALRGIGDLPIIRATCRVALMRNAPSKHPTVSTSLIHQHAPNPRAR